MELSTTGDRTSPPSAWPHRAKLKTTGVGKEDVEKGEPSCTVGASATAATLENRAEAPQDVKNRAALQPSDCTAGYLPKGPLLPAHGSVSHTAQTREQPECPSVDAGIKKMWRIDVQSNTVHLKHGGSCDTRNNMAGPGGQFVRERSPSPRHTCRCRGRADGEGQSATRAATLKDARGPEVGGGDGRHQCAGAPCR